MVCVPITKIYTLGRSAFFSFFCYTKSCNKEARIYRRRTTKSQPSPTALSPHFENKYNILKARYIDSIRVLLNHCCFLICFVFSSFLHFSLVLKKVLDKFQKTNKLILGEKDSVGDADHLIKLVSPYMAFRFICIYGFCFSTKMAPIIPTRYPRP